MTILELAPTGGQLRLSSLEAYSRYTDEWLRNRRLSDHTRAAYRRDAQDWLDWCAAQDLDPLAVRFTDVNAYGRHLEATLNPRTTRPMTVATVARKLSAVSSWYAFLVKLGALTANPAADADRPRVDRDHSSTVGLTREEATALIAAADADPYPNRPRTRALVRLLVDLGIRVTEACRADLSDLGHADGHRVLVVHGKGGKTRRRSLPPAVAGPLDAYLEVRASREGVAVGNLSGPVFVTSSGRPLDRAEVFCLIRRLARAAGIAAWAQMSPHSLRHAWNRIAREGGADLETRQAAMGHADPRTTRRYDSSVEALDKDPSYLVAAATAQPGMAGRIHPPERESKEGCP